MKKLIILFLINVFVIKAFSQVSINLDNAIELGKINYPSITKAEIQKNIAEINLQTSKNAFLPTVTGSINANSSWGLSIDPSTNILTRDNTMAQNATLNGSLTLFNGFRNINNVKINEYTAQQTNLQLKKMENDLSLQIIQIFFQHLFYKEQMRNASESLELIEKQRKLILGFVEGGILHKRDLLNMDYQMAEAELLKISAQNSMSLSKFNLSKLCSIKNIDSVDFVFDNTDFMDENWLMQKIDFSILDSVTKNNLPDIKIAELYKSIAFYNLKYAKGNLYPIISLNAKLGTQTSSLQYDYYFDQLNINQNQNLSLSLIFPIYNKHLYKQNIRLAEQNIKTNEAILVETTIALEQIVKSLHTEFLVSIKKYEVLKQQFASVSEEMKYADRLLEIGTFNISEFAETRKRFETAKSYLLQAKYDLYFKRKMIDFYLGKFNK